MPLQVSSSSPSPDTEWQEGLKSIRQMGPPGDYGGIQLPRWKALVEDVGSFLDRWQDEADALGWTTIDLFGCSRAKPYARIDLAGLVLLLNGQWVVEMTADTAFIELPGGRHSRFMRRPPSPEQVAVWELAC